MNTHLVIGAGEVGTALAKILNADLRDLTPEPHHADHYDTLHIAFPWTPNFTDLVLTYDADYQASHIVIHSTVPIGTCDPHGWTHSPIRGRHPHLTEGLLAFTKHAGGPNAEHDATVFQRRGIRVRIHDQAATTEAGKLWELAALAIEVRLQKEIHAHCQRLDLPYREVYEEFATSYNHGYARLGEAQFIKPILTHMPGPIGGHCVAPNAPMLFNPWIDDTINALTEPSALVDLEPTP